MPTQVSDNILLALYFALCAVRKGTTKIVISNDDLKRYFFGDKPGKRLSERKISDWAEVLKPMLRYRVKRSQHGPFLMLYLGEKTDPTLEPARLSIPHRITIHKTLGIQ